jgi:hypothetical protein
MIKTEALNIINLTKVLLNAGKKWKLSHVLYKKQFLPWQAKSYYASYNFYYAVTDKNKIKENNSNSFSFQKNYFIIRYLLIVN